MTESHNFGTPAEDTPERDLPSDPVAADAATAPHDRATAPDDRSAAGAAPAQKRGDRTPEEIRAEIEQTREALGETVEALAEKTDVKARASDELHAVRENVSQTVADARESVTQKAAEMRQRAQEATPESAQAGVGQIGATVQERPWPFATAGAFAAGLLVGWWLGRR